MRPPPLLALTSALGVGGSSTFLLNLGITLRQRGERFPVICFEPNNAHAADFAAAQMPVHCLRDRPRIFEDSILEAYEEAAREQPPAVMACLGSQSFEVLRMMPPGVIRIGLIQSHDPGPYGVIEGYRPWLDAVVGVSPTITHHLQTKSGFPKAICIPYGIQFPPPIIRPLQGPAEPLRLIYLGRMVEEHKRVSRLVALARLLAEKKLPFEFHLVGSGPQEREIQQAMAPFPQVKMLATVPNHQVTDLLRRSDIMILLSDYEGLPLSLLEAMGEGVVPVISDLESGVREIVDENIGVRVPIGDVAAAALAICALAENRNRLATLSSNASKLARERYSAQRMTDSYLDLLGTFPATQPVWPARFTVPRPQFVKPGWLFSGFPRQLRRWRKRLSS